MKLSMESSRSFSQAVTTLFLSVACMELPEQVMLLSNILLYVLLATRCFGVGLFLKSFFFYLFGNKQLPSLFSKCLSFNETNVGISRSFFGHNCI